jgi:DNA-binding MarR family transcriptional regulator
MDDMHKLIREIRTFYNSLVMLGDAIHSEESITLGMRAVMEALLEEGPHTVPQIARSRRVSRQRIQIMVNHLLDEGLVAHRANPANSRSHLIALTRSGAAAIKRMRGREAERFADLPGNLDVKQLTQQLAQLRISLEQSQLRPTKS